MAAVLFGVSTWLWESPFNNDSIHLFERIKEMGFDVVEIPVEDPTLIDSNEILEALSRYELKAVVCGVFGPTKDFTHDNPLVHKHCFEYIRQCFEFCQSWGSEFLAGPMYSAVGKARLVSEEQKRIEWGRAVENLHNVCQMAEDFGLDIAIEPLNRFESDLVNTAEDALRLVKDINHPRAKILLDSFHMTIEERNLYRAIKLVGDKLIHVQVSENHRGVPGSGLTPWEDVKRGLKEIDYQGCISIESFTPENKELAAAVCIWKTMEETQDLFATKGLNFLKNTFIA